MKLYERIMELAFNRLFFYPSNEPYGSIAGFYDYGPVGSNIKRRIANLWRREFVIKEGFFEVESSIVTPEIVLKASGHVDEFTDPIIECKDCHSKLRADKFLEEKIPNFSWDGRLESIDNAIRENNIRCPVCGGSFLPAYFVNLMFKTEIGYDGNRAYLRPETAQGIFTSFIRIYRNGIGKLPFGVAQIGKSFRNEISPRRALVRLREFTQMELEYFFDPADDHHEKYVEKADVKVRVLTREAQMEGGKVEEMSVEELLERGIAANEIMAYFLARVWEFYLSLGIEKDRMHFRHLMPEETPHYSKSNVDLEIETSFGVIEVVSNAYRTDYDLSRHEEFSKKSFAVVGREGKIIPHVFEISVGLDRTFFAVLEHSYRGKSEEKGWEWFDFPPEIAPYDVAVFPLLKKDGHPEKAREVANMLMKEGFLVHYRESGSIGRRYARADEIGIPYALTIDHQTLEDDTVTIRYRNDGKQERVYIPSLPQKLREMKEKGKVSL